MAQLDSGAIECRPVTFRLDELVDARCGTLASQAQAKNLALAAASARADVAPGESGVAPGESGRGTQGIRGAADVRDCAR